MSAPLSTFSSQLSILAALRPKMEDTRLEQTSFSAANNAICESGAAKCAANSIDDPQLSLVAAIWADLPEDVRQKIVLLATAGVTRTTGKGAAMLDNVHRQGWA